MIRKAFLIQVKEGMAAEYKRRHDEIWPELAVHYRAHGVENFSIFLEEESGMLFGYLEVRDEASYERIGEAEICRRWWKYMTEVLVCEKEGDSKGKEIILKEVFYLA